MKKKWLKILMAVTALALVLGDRFLQLCILFLVVRHKVHNPLVIIEAHVKANMLAHLQIILS